MLTQCPTDVQGWCSSSDIRSTAFRENYALFIISVKEVMSPGGITGGSEK